VREEEEEKWRRASSGGPHAARRGPTHVGRRSVGGDPVGTSDGVARSGRHQRCPKAQARAVDRRRVTDMWGPLAFKIKSIFQLFQLCNSIQTPSLSLKILKLCKVTYLNTSNNFPFCLDFKFHMDFELKILELIQI
jgi:hypothetical protein